MLRDVVKLGAITAVGLGVVATVGVGVGVFAIVAGVVLAGVASAESTTETEGSNKGSTPKAPGKPSSPPPSTQEKRPSPATTKKKATTDIAVEPKPARSPESKNYAPYGGDERKVPLATLTTIEPKADHAPESKTSAANGRDERTVPTPTPNRKRSASVVVSQPGDVISSASREGAQIVGSSNAIASPLKPTSLSRELEAQIASEVKEWRNEKSLNPEPRKRGPATGRGGIEKRISPAVQAKTEIVSAPQPSTSLSSSGPLPLLPPSPTLKPKSTPHMSGAVVELPKPEPTSEPLSKPVEEEDPSPAQNGLSREEPSLSKPGDHPPVPSISLLSDSPPLLAVPAQESQTNSPVPLSRTQESEAPQHLDASPSMPSAPNVESSVLLPDTVLAAAASSLFLPNIKPESESLITPSTSTIREPNAVVLNGSGTLHGPASASRDSLASVQRKNFKITSAAKKVSHSVKKVFKSPDGKISRSDSPRLTSSSSDSIDSQQIIIDPDQGGRAHSKLASSSRESLASTKSRRSLIDGTKKGLKRMFKRSSDNIEVPPVPALPSLASTVPETSSIVSGKPVVIPSESTPAPKPVKNISANVQQQPHASTAQGSVRNAPGAPDSGNNASPLLKGMFKGRRVRR